MNWSYLLTFWFSELHKDGRTEISLLVEVREVVGRYPSGGMVDNGAHVLLVCRVLSLAVQPHTVVLKRTLSLSVKSDFYSHIYGPLRGVLGGGVLTNGLMDRGDLPGFPCPPLCSF